MTVPFGDRLTACFEARGRLCVGIDPHAYLLHDWGLTDNAAGVRDFGLRVVDAAVGRIGIVKPQVAFFERFGSAGVSALEDVMAAARTAGLLVIADAKRGDVGTTVEAYAEAWLLPGSPLEADAMTMSAYQGVGSITVPLEIAERHGKGIFVLAATSNPEAMPGQSAIIRSGSRSGMTVAAGIVGEVNEWNSANASSKVGSAGVVLGATVDFSDFGIDLGSLAREPATPVLAPGFGHQGARVDRLGELYGPAASHSIVSASRSILSSGPKGIADAIAAQAQEVTAWSV